MNSVLRPGLLLLVFGVFRAGVTVYNITEGVKDSHMKQIIFMITAVVILFIACLFNLLTLSMV